MSLQQFYEFAHHAVAQAALSTSKEQRSANVVKAVIALRIQKTKCLSVRELEALVDLQPGAMWLLVSDLLAMDLIYTQQEVTPWDFDNVVYTLCETERDIVNYHIASNLLH